MPTVSPSTRKSRTVKAIEGPVRAQEGLLHQVLGVVSVPRHSVRGPEEGSQMGKHLRLESLVAVQIAPSPASSPIERNAPRPPIIPIAGF